MTKKKFLILFCILGFLIFLFFEIPSYFNREIKGPYYEVEGIIVDRAATTVYLGGYKSGWTEVRTYVVIEEDGIEWGGLLPKFSASSFDKGLLVVGNKVKAKIGYEVLTQHEVIIAVEKTESIAE